MPTIVAGDIELGHILGSGGFGKVYSAFDRKNQRNVAVKVIDKRLVKENGLVEYVEREIAMMRKIKHPHVVRLLSATNSRSAYYLVMELAVGGELFDKIVDSKRFDEATARRYFQQLISAVHYCHRHGIVHRDLKAENLLLGDNGELRVCDFGLSRYMNDVGSSDMAVLFTSLAGSMDYQAPEVLRERGYQGGSCDMWSCGVLLFFMLCGYLPFTDRSDVLTRRRILHAQFNRNTKYLTEGARSLIVKLLEVDPALRYTSLQVINDPWFTVDLDLSLFPDDEIHMSPMNSPKSSDAIHSVQSPTVSSPRNGSQLDDIHRAFKTINVSQDGFLNREEVRDALIKMHENEAVSDQEVDEFMKGFALDAEGRITEEKFVLGWTDNEEFERKYSVQRLANLFHYNLQSKILQDIRKAFDVLDVDHTGILTREGIRKLNINVTDEDFDDFLQALGVQVTKEKPTVTFERFVSICEQYNVFQHHPLSARLRHLELFFEVTESQVLGSMVSSGYTVAGNRDGIRVKIMSHCEALSTTFEGSSFIDTIYGSYSENSKKVLEVGVRLLPAAPGYTKVVPYRIRGKTETFHQWFRELRRVLKEEILRFEEDTAVKGESELL